MPIPALALSFDLIGFGEADSAVLVRDVQLLSDLLAHDNAVSTAEDTPVHIDVMGNRRDWREHRRAAGAGGGAAAWQRGA